MHNPAQIERYKRLLSFIDGHLKEDIGIPEIEAACHYSYRNINRIFEAVQGETIGKHIKRMRLERGAQFLKYSQQPVSDIAFEVGYADVAAFSNAFKKHFHCSPRAFREANTPFETEVKPSLETGTKALEYRIEQLPDLLMLGLEYRGSYQDIAAIDRLWEDFIAYAETKKLLREDSVFMAQLLDDNDISDTIHCRYHLGMLLQRELDFEPEGLYRVKPIEACRYAVFVHQGPYERTEATYQHIYAQWLAHMPYEMKDAPVLEFFLNDASEVPEAELLTEIYIPVE